MTVKAKRKAISTKLRFEIFKRDSFICQYCGAHPPTALLHIDHIIAVAEGGTTDDDNLVTACDQCNFGKGARSLAAVPKSLGDKAKETAEREEQIRGYSEVMMARRERIDRDCWSVIRVFNDYFNPEDQTFRRDWFASVRRFVVELGVDECIDAIETAINKTRYSDYQCFRYFCGVCWTKIREMRQCDQET